MKNFYCLLIILVLLTGAKAQSCLPDGITFYTQTEIDNFPINYPNCTQIEGDLIFDNYCEAITNFNALSILTYVGGSVEIGNYVNGGLEYLTSLEGLNGLTAIGGGLHIYACPLITDLTGLNNLASIGGDFFLDGNGNLLNLSGLNKLTSIGGQLQIKNNFVLTTLTGIDNISSIGSHLVISYNPYLTDISSLKHINPATIDNLAINGNGSLTSCAIDCICNYLASPNGHVVIYSNASGCNDPIEIANECGFSISCLPFGNYYLLSQSDIDNFKSNYPGCTDLMQHMVICGDDITNLDGLNEITSIEGLLSIGNNENGTNPLLTSLEGLDALTSVGNLFINSNNALARLSGLDNLTTLSGNLSINNNEVLSNINSLLSVTSINGGMIYIDNNSILTSLEGLDSIAAGSIFYLSIHDNYNLSTCDVNSICEYLISPIGGFEIFDNNTGCNNEDEILEACGVGLNENINSAVQVELFPNPASTYITIKISNAPSISQLSIFNIKGQQLYIQQITERTAVIDVSDLPQGIYYIKLKCESSLQVFKMVKN